MIRLAFAAFASFSAVLPAAAQNAVPAVAAQQTTMDHISIVSMGSGEPVFLIPGMSSPRAVWDGIAPRLAKTHRVLLVEVNGFAGSDPGKNLEPGVLDGIISDMLGYADREKLVRPAVIGHSMGGLVGMMVAARHPDRVGSLMVVDALPFFGVLFDPAATAQSVEPRAAMMRDALAKGADPTGSAPVTTDPGGIWSNTPAGRIQVANWSRMANPKVVAQALYEDVVADLRPELGKITARPFTVLYATGAGPQATVLWEREYQGSPATLVPVPDSYHFIMLDQPERFAAEVERFLAE